jgi:hypothetical protein
MAAALKNHEVGIIKKQTFQRGHRAEEIIGVELGSHMMNAIHGHIAQRPHTIDLSLAHAALQHLNVFGDGVARTMGGQVAVLQVDDTSAQLPVFITTIKNEMMTMR